MENYGDQNYITCPEEDEIKSTNYSRKNVHEAAWKCYRLQMPNCLKSLDSSHGTI